MKTVTLDSLAHPTALDSNPGRLCTHAAREPQPRVNQLDNIDLPIIMHISKWFSSLDDNSLTKVMLANPTILKENANRLVFSIPTESQIMFIYKPFTGDLVSFFRSAVKHELMCRDLERDGWLESLAQKRESSR